MSVGWQVTVECLAKWVETDSRRSQETLPLLVKRLIFASVNPSLIRFPSGDSVLNPGWDGILRTEVGSLYVPQGDSVWELSTSKALFRKANKDFSKRTANSGSIDQKSSTFVFVTSQKWLKAADWAKEKEASSQWAHVRVITAEELADWLEKCPAVHRWFARLIGNRPTGAWDGEQAWDSWRLATKPPCNTDLAIAGRRDQSTKLSELLSLKPELISVSAETKEEACAFVLASIKTHEWLLPRLLVVRDPKEWDILVDSFQSLILIPLFDELPTLGLATQRGHWVVVPSFFIQGDMNATITLDRANEDQQVRALVAMGLSDGDAQHIVHSSRAKFHIIRRHRALAQIGQQKPDWATSSNAEALVAALLVGSWLSDNKNDCEKIAYLAGISYDKFEQSLNKWLRTGDYPVEHRGNRWQIVSYVDSWQFLHPYISECVLERFGETAVNVLREFDPRFELAPEERWLASVQHKVPIFSVPLRHGMAKALAMLGSYGDKDCKSTGSNSVQSKVSFWVRQILIENMSDQLWGSLAPELALLAEAAPEIFLQAVELGLEGEKSPVMSLFVEEGPMGGCLHADLLRGLECISWDLNYTSRAVFILAKLASNDPGGKWLNRPYNTLKTIFLGWLPQTKVPLDKRIEILDALIRYRPDLGWKLLIDLLPERGGGVSTPIYAPYFRDWKNGWAKGVTWNEYHQHVAAISERILQHVSEEPKTRWLSVLKNLSSLPPKYVCRAINQLDKDITALPTDVKIEIHNTIRELVSTHRQYSSAKWALPKNYVDELDAICSKTLPGDLVIRYKFLFDDVYPALRNPAPYTNHEEKSKRSEEERIAALEQIWGKEQIFGIERLAKIIQLPGLLGNSLENTTFTDQIETTVLCWLDSENASLLQTARAYVTSRFSKRHNEWLVTLREKYVNCWSEKTWTSFCLGLPFNKFLFDFLENFNEPVKKGFWENVRRYFLQEEDKAYASWVIEQLLTYRRPFAAIDAAACFLHTVAKDTQLDGDVLAKALEQAANDPADFEIATIGNRRYDLVRVLEEIEIEGKIEPNRLARIEWMYMPVLHDNKIKPKTLLNEILVNPNIFVHLVCMMFNANPPIENEFPNMSPDQKKQQALNAWHLLELIDQVPGQCSSTEIDGAQLQEWVRQARQSFEQKSRKKIGDEQIGHVLSQAPVGKDNIWPHEAVRDIIERCESLDIEMGIEVGKSNQRGVTTRAVGEGGAQERKIAEAYEQAAEKIKFEFPRTAGLLLRLAGSYKFEADINDKLDFELDR